MVLTLEIPITPIGKQRPRACVVGGHARVYTPSKTSNYEYQIRKAFQDKYPNHEPIRGEVRLIIHSYFPYPKSAYWPVNKNHDGELREDWKNKAMLSKPDLDNIEKAIMDALNKVAWVDDSQITYKTSAKDYSEKPGIVVEIHY